MNKLMYSIISRIHFCFLLDNNLKHIIHLNLFENAFYKVNKINHFNSLHPPLKLQTQTIKGAAAHEQQVFFAGIMGFYPVSQFVFIAEGKGAIAKTGCNFCFI